MLIQAACSYASDFSGQELPFMSFTFRTTTNICFDLGPEWSMSVH